MTKVFFFKGPKCVYESITFPEVSKFVLKGAESLTDHNLHVKALMGFPSDIDFDENNGNTYHKESHNAKSDRQPKQSP